MGAIEKEAKNIRRRTNIQKVLLGTIATVGMLSVAALAPNALQALSVLEGGRMRKQNPKYLIGNAFEKILARGFVRIVRRGEKKYVTLTAAGKHQLGAMMVRAKDPRRHRRWDGRWRVVIYDIAQEKNYVRSRLRTAIQAFGFQRLQQSIWVYPYECEELVILLKANCKIGTDVLYMVVEKIENDQELKKKFNLPRAR